MANTEQTGRDFSTISPSAKSLLLLKGLTSIPFAREAARLMTEPEAYEPDYTLRDASLWGRVLHFEARYWSIGQLMNEMNPRNILELSSGYSLRGLDTSLNNPVHYIDTDLPDVIAAKQIFLEQLQTEMTEPRGKLELFPLNALNETQFAATVNRFNDGEITIVNEGLMMYLDTDEKQKLCDNIRNRLKQRGGCWITADVYVKRPDIESMTANDELKHFFERHNIEGNKFESFEAAELFFKDAGFMIERKSVTDYSKLTALPYFLQSVTPDRLEKMREGGKMQETWRLRVA